MRQSADFRFKLRAPKSLHLLKSCTFIVSIGLSQKLYFGQHSEELEIPRSLLAGMT